MPKTNLCKADPRDKFLKLMLAKIDYGMTYQGKDVTDLALVMRVEPRTVYNRLKKPEEFRLKEILAVCKLLKIPPTELMSDQGLFT